MLSLETMGWYARTTTANAIRFLQLVLSVEGQLHRLRRQPALASLMHRVIGAFRRAAGVSLGRRRGARIDTGDRWSDSGRTGVRLAWR